MMSILIEQLINITDAIFLGHVGEIELGASALAGIWYLAIYMLGFGFSIGLQVVIARRNGEQQYSETGKTFFQGLLFLSGLAVLLCSISKTISPMILSNLIASEKVYFQHHIECNGCAFCFLVCFYNGFTQSVIHICTG